jgi:hypothetical protein
VVGLVGIRTSSLGNVKLRVPQLQIPGMFLRPLGIEDLFVPLLAPGYVTGLDICVLDTTDPDAAFRHIGWNIGVTFCHTSYLQLADISQTKLVAP